MNKKFYAVLTAALIGLAMSCGSAGEDAINAIIGGGEMETAGVFARFNAGGADPATQQVNLLRSTAPAPVITFHDENINSEEDWLLSKDLASYDFIADPGGYGPNKKTSDAGGGGGTPQEESVSVANSLRDDIPSDTEDLPEYTITGLSITYRPDISKLVIPSIEGSEFISWKIFQLNSALSNTGPAAGETIIPEELSYTLTHTLSTGEPLTFPASKLLKTSNSPAITINAVFKLDEHTATAIAQIKETISSIDDRLKAAAEGEAVSSLYSDEYLVGATKKDDSSKALQAAIEKAQEAAAGKDVVTTIPSGDFVRYTEDDDDGHKAGDYVLNVEGEKTPDEAVVTYHVYEIAEIEKANTELEKAIETAIANKLTTYTHNSVELSSTEAGDKRYKSVTIVDGGVYRITISGANGGHVWSQSGNTDFGGKGGSVSALKVFNAGDILKVRIGTEGDGTAIFDSATNALVANASIGGNNPAGGWPNGGLGGKRYDNSTPGAGGGGATEVYYAGNHASTPITFDNANTARNTEAILLFVAGGGGGAGSIPRVGKANGEVARTSLPGGDAGEKPVPARRRGKQESTVKEYVLADGLKKPYEHITAGTYSKFRELVETDTTYWYGEYAPNAVVTYDNDTTPTGNGAKGWNGNQTGNNSNFEGGGGGGGGYYGGNAIVNLTSLVAGDNTGYGSGGGGGGSNYISGTMSATGGTVSATAATYGNGTFRIEWSSDGN
ncbi:MAG: hypothetical protein LBJ35_04260 [Spirochaetaceae bacterium]|jgi:hypothetical protein|nr:hypothetical protein [Spirochaetaceae bacterium]